MTTLEKQRTKAIEEYWKVINPKQGSIVATNPLIQELVVLCRASDSFVVTAFKAENWGAEEELEEDLLLAELDFYQKFVVFAKKLENDRSRIMGEIGSIKSEKKATASRENGKKGGRPRKKLLEPEREEQLGFTGAEGLFSETPRKSPAN